MTDITKLSIRSIIRSLKEKRFSSKELVTELLNKAEERKDLNAFVHLPRDLILDNAEKSDKLIASGAARSMEGVPIGIKDLFCTSDMPTTSASNILRNFHPHYESTVTQNLLDEGVVKFGKINMDEFAMGSSNTNSCFGPSINPWKDTTAPHEPLVPGGSSGGSCSAVSAGLVPGALGSDTGGSIRQPSSFCGVVGIRPTYGRCSRWGMVAFSSSLDQAGVITRSVDDAALLLSTIAGYDPKDSTSIVLPKPDFTKMVNAGVKGMKIGVVKEYKVDQINHDITDALDDCARELEKAGATIVHISLPHSHYALPTYYILAMSEMSSNLARYDGVKYGYRTKSAYNSLEEMISITRDEGFGEEVKRRIMIGTYVLASKHYDGYYIQTQKIRRVITQDFVDAFKEVDVILAPSTPTTAFKLSESNKMDPLVMYANDIFTVPSSLAGLPGMSLPIKLCTKKQLPIGLQIIGPHYQEDRLFQCGQVIEDAFAFADKYSPQF